MSATDTILEVGNSLVGYVQGISDLSKNPTGVDQAAAIHGLAGVVVSAIGTADTPFLRALTTGVGINLGANSIVLAGISLSQSYSAYNQALATGNATSIAAAQRDVVDKLLGAVGAIGATIATIPTPATKTVGLTIWFGATLGQQFYNGNAQRLFDIIGTETSNLLKSIIGGPSVELWQHQTDHSEVVTTLFRDDRGVPVAELGKMSSGAKFSTIEVSVKDGWLVHVHAGTTYLWSFFRPDAPSTQSTQLQKFNVTQQAFDNALSSPWASSWNLGITDSSFNSVEVASNILSTLGISTPIHNFLLPGSDSQQFSFANWNAGLEWQKHMLGQPSDIGYWFDQITSFSDEFGLSAADEFVTLVVTGKLLDPLAIDLNRDGSFASSGQMDVEFDLLGDGHRSPATWLNSGDGFLAIDRNGNGRIDDGSELFAGRLPGESYQQLARYDRNSDGSVDAQEAAEGQIIVWTDVNRDGQTNDGEMFTFDTLGIQSISLQYSDRTKLEAGGFVTQISAVQYSNGSTGTIADIFLGQSGGSAGELPRDNTTTQAAQLVHDMASWTAGAEAVALTDYQQRDHALWKGAMMMVA